MLSVEFSPISFAINIDIELSKTSYTFSNETAGLINTELDEFMLANLLL